MTEYSKADDFYPPQEQSGWYVIKSIPGSQQPQKNLVTIRTASKKGYKVCSEINHQISAIEKSLNDAGFWCYMPSEKRLIRDRKHTDLFKTRRFALMVGYVFVYCPRSLLTLDRTPNVMYVVRDGNGVPVQVSWADIHHLRKQEAISEEQFRRDIKSARQTLRKKAKKDPIIAALVKRLDIAGEMSVPVSELSEIG